MRKNLTNGYEISHRSGPDYAVLYHNGKEVATYNSSGILQSVSIPSDDLIAAGDYCIALLEFIDVCKTMKRETASGYAGKPCELCKSLGRPYNHMQNRACLDG